MYVVLPRLLLAPNDPDLLKFLSLHHTSPQIIFNSLAQDRRRLQTILPPYLDEPWAKNVKETLAELVPLLSMRESACLQSLPGCRKQRKHTDYDALATKQCTVKPHSLLIAISPGTKLHLWPKDGEEGDTGGGGKEVVVELSPGDGILFRGDTVHAGAAYAQENVRLFAYLDSPELQREPNRTYFPPKVWCYCQKPDDHEVYVECHGKKRCPFGGWVHVKCLSHSEHVQDEQPFWCKRCAKKSPH